MLSLNISERKVPSMNIHVKNIIGYFLMICSVVFLLLIIVLVGPFSFLGIIFIMLLFLGANEIYEYFIKK